MYYDRVPPFQSWFVIRVSGEWTLTFGKNMTNPYQTPQDSGDADTVNAVEAPQGLPCKECGSTNTTTDSVLRSKPSVIAVIFFGWLFLLIRGAFAMRTSCCRECGKTRRYKSLGSWIALWIVLLLGTFIIAGIFIEG